MSVVQGDCLATLRTFADNSIDACLTDPPYELGFMGKAWDRTGIAFSPETWAEVLRVLKPGAHLLAFGGTRTYHRMACAIEDAGFEVRDSIHWIYGTGFPKSLDVSKAIDKLDAAEERRRRNLTFTAWMRSTGITSSRINALTNTNMGGHYLTAAEQPAVATAELFDLLRPHLPPVPEEIEQLVRERTVESENLKARGVVGFHSDAGMNRVRATYDERSSSSSAGVIIGPAATDIARQWEGWGTALKPAHEPIIVARKPFPGTVAANVQEHGTGALNVDGCRVEGGGNKTFVRVQGNRSREEYRTGTTDGPAIPSDLGRWPPNVVFTHSPDCGDACAEDCPVRHLDEEAGPRPTGAWSGHRNTPKTKNAFGAFEGRQETPREATTGTASRFFPVFRYAAKPSRKERDAGLLHLPVASGGEATDREDGSAGLSSPRAGAGRTGGARNTHPTVKPIALLRWLARLVTPPGGIILDPFAGSGSTGCAAALEHFRFIGCELSPAYCEIAEARIAHWAKAAEEIQAANEQRLLFAEGA